MSAANNLSDDKAGDLALKVTGLRMFISDWADGRHEVDVDFVVKIAEISPPAMRTRIAKWLCVTAPMALPHGRFDGDRVRAVFMAAVENGATRTALAIGDAYPSKMVGMKHEIVCSACSAGHDEVAKLFLRESDRIPPDEMAVASFSRACREGHLSSAKWMLSRMESECAFIRKYTTDHTVDCKSIPVLEWFLDVANRLLRKSSRNSRSRALARTTTCASRNSSGRNATRRVVDH